MKECRVIAQFPVSRSFLLEGRNPIKGFMKNDLIRHLVKKNRESQRLLIRDLQTGMSHVNLKAKVLEIPRPKRVLTRFGNYASVANVLIADETGTIKLCLWNEKINSVSVNSVIQIENASVTKFRGENQLRLGKNGRLSMVENAIFHTPSHIEKSLLQTTA
jgi:replication factor A1